MEISAMIDKYLGQPFREGEADCYTLVVNWFKELGHELPDFRHDRYWHGERIELENYFRLWRKLEDGELPKPHDGIFMKNAFGNKYHMGVITGNGMFIHCTKQGVVQDRINKYKRIIRGIYRLKAFGG